MFSQEEIEFLNGELARFSQKVEERLLADNTSAEQRERFEKRLSLATSIRRKLENEKRLKTVKPYEVLPVLVIDDMDSTLQVTKQSLLNIGFKKVEAITSAVAGLKKLKEAITYERPYTLVVCDWKMPKMSGMDLLKEVRGDKELWALPFFLLSSKSEQTDIIKALESGATGYITKPASPADLKEKLHDYIVK